jgi:hypothetical protein
MALSRRFVVALVVVAGSGPASPAMAGSLLDWLGCGPCPPPSYCPARYWTPRPARGYDCLCGPRLSVYAPDRHPEITPTFLNIPYPCPPADPVTTIIERPTPPAESAFRYLGGGGGTVAPTPGTTPPAPMNGTTPPTPR